MTAINVIRQPAAVHVLTDGAGYRADGALAWRVQKIFPLAHLEAVIAARGAPLLAPMFAHHVSIMAGCFDELIGMAPAAAREESENVPPEFRGDFDLMIAGLGLDGAPASFALSSHDRNGFDAWRVTELGAISLSPCDDAIKADLAAAYPNGIEARDFDPVADGLRVLEIQRRHKTEHHWDGQVTAQFAVGGFAQLTTITPEGIATRILRRWPDQIGRTINA